MGTHRSGGLTSGVRARVIICAPAAVVSNALLDELPAVGFEVVTASGLDELVSETEPAIVVIDDHEQTWLRTVSAIAEHPAGLRPFVLAERNDPDLFLAAIAAGAVGFCESSAPLDGIARAIESVRDEGYAVPRSMTASLVDHVRHGRGRMVNTAAGRIDVTDREWQILALLMQRRSTREIADALFVSVGTVRSHVSALLKKLGAVDREDAIRMIERGNQRT